MVDNQAKDDGWRFLFEVSYKDADGRELLASLRRSESEQNAPVLGRTDFDVEKLSLRCVDSPEREISISEANAIAYALDQFVRESHHKGTAPAELAANLTVTIGEDDPWEEVVPFSVPISDNPLSKHCESLRAMM